MKLRLNHPLPHIVMYASLCIAMWDFSSAQAAYDWAVMVKGEGPRDMAVMSGCVVHSDKSGFYVLTNHHFVRDSNFTRIRVGVVNRGWYDAQWLGSHPKLDLGLMHVKTAHTIQRVKFAGHAPEQGKFRLIGYPRGTQYQTTKKGFRRTTRFVSGDIEFSMGAVQGDSGAPIVDEYDRLVGLNWGGGANGASSSIAIPVEHIRPWLRDVIPHQEQVPPAPVKLSDGSWSAPVQQTQYQCYGGYCPTPQPVYRSQPRIVTQQPTIVQRGLGPKVVQQQRVCACDTDKIVELVLARIKQDPQFQPIQGPPGRPGRDGQQGPPGQDGTVSQSQVNAICAAILQQIRNDPAFKGPVGPPGPPGKDAETTNINYPDRRVVVVDGAMQRIIDDETYTADEPIVIDVRAIQNAR